MYEVIYKEKTSTEHRILRFSSLISRHRKRM